MSRKGTRWLPLSVLGALVALVGGLALISAAQASPAAVSIGSATVAPGGTTTVDLTVTPAAGETVGTLVVEVAFTADLTATACTPAATCNIGFGNPTATPTPTPGPVAGPGIVGFAFADAAGLTGVEGTITFQAGQTETTVPLTLTITTCTDDLGEPLATCTATNGSITIQTPTPTPTPSPTTAPTPTPTPTASPAALPPTGGTSSDGSSTSIAWVVGALGLAVLAGGVWAVSQKRRHSV